METVKLLLYKNGHPVVAHLVQEGEDIDDEEGMSVYQPVRLEFPNGEFDVNQLHEQALRDVVYVAMPSHAALLDTNPYIILQTLGCLGFKFDMPQAWKDEINAGAKAKRTY
ncbi:hypothetical protein PCI56_25020 [Plesiomonas shigelloides subsp. oncorhynchi]|nr:hypothetical protein [Plesiomonas shigelloides]